MEAWRGCDLWTIGVIFHVQGGEHIGRVYVKLDKREYLLYELDVRLRRGDGVDAGGGSLCGGKSKNKLYVKKDLSAQGDIIYLDISEWMKRGLIGHMTMVEGAHVWIHGEWGFVDTYSKKSFTKNRPRFFTPNQGWACPTGF